MRERSYVQRNKRVELREITDLVALRKEDARGEETGESHIPEQLAPEVPESQLRAFENAGWVFQEKGAEEEARDDAPKAQVFVKSGGRLALGTNVLTVQLKEMRTKEEADAALAPYGCRVIESLTFAPGLFRVAVEDTSEGDAVDVANKLLNSGLVEFAEPELIEVHGPRSY